MNALFTTFSSFVLTRALPMTSPHQRRAGADAFSPAELKFVESFRSKVTLPEVLPNWLWGGSAESYWKQVGAPATASPNSSGRNGARRGRAGGGSTSRASEAGSAMQTPMADGSFLPASIEALALEPGALRA